MNPHVRLSVGPLAGWSVGRSVIVFLKAEKLRFHAPIGTHIIIIENGSF